MRYLKKLEIVKKWMEVSPAFKEEIEHKMDIEHEGSYSLHDAFEEVSDFAEEGVLHNSARIWSVCKQIHIETGNAKAMSQEDLDNTQVSHGKKYWFKFKGVCYQ